MRFNEAQIKLYDTAKWFRDHRLPVRMVLCKSRRAGLSTGVEAMIYDDSTLNSNTDSLIVAHQTSSAENVLEMCNRFWNNTPESISFGDYGIISVRPPLIPAMQGRTSRTSMRFDAPLSSRIFIATARSIDAFLGYGFQNIHATEASRYPNGEELFRALTPCLSTDPHSALYVESTPNGQTGDGEWFYQLCMDATQRKTTEYGETKMVFIPWHEMRYSFYLPFKDDSYRAAFERSLNPGEKELVRRFPHLLMEQLNWRRMVLASMNEELFDQEYPTDLATAFLTSGKSLFSMKTLRRMAGEVKKPEWRGDIYWGDSDDANEQAAVHDVVRLPKLLEKGEARAQGWKSKVNEGTYENLLVWKFPRKGDRLFLGCDVGEGKAESRDGDFSTIVVTRLSEDPDEPNDYMMRWKGHLNPLDFAELASALAWWLKYRVGAKVSSPELIPEWTGPGRAMCTEIDHHRLYPHLYSYQKLDIRGAPKTKGLGWESNNKSKNFMVAHLLRAVERNYISIPDQECVEQCASYRQFDSMGDSESYGGAAGRHDDIISGLQIANAVMQLRTMAIPMIDDVREVREFDSSGPGDTDFDPFRFSQPFGGVMPGRFDHSAADDDSLAEAAYWSAGRIGIFGGYEE